MWKTVREALAVVLMIPPRDDRTGHERRTVLIVVGVIVIALVLVAITLLARGSTSTKKSFVAWARVIYAWRGSLGAAAARPAPCRGTQLRTIA